MSGPYYKVKQKRSRKVTHFTEEDVSMKALNDPLLPHHPPSPEPRSLTKGSLFRYYDIDLSNLAQPRSSSVAHRANEPVTRPLPGHQNDGSNGAAKPDQIDQYEELPLRYQVSHGKSSCGISFKIKQEMISLQGMAGVRFVNDVNTGQKCSRLSLP